MAMVGSTLSGKTVGIMGLGRIGLATAKRIAAFEPGRIIYTATKQKIEAEAMLNVEFVSFEQLLADSDVILINSALTKDTEGIFNSVAFKRMKKSAIIINTSRGGLINQDDLVQALKVRGIIRLLLVIQLNANYTTSTGGRNWWCWT